jgi:Cyclic GMP-AMP synthase DncV-like, nucleotidyltransferase domain/Adenylyl/Guanylyl and SMODS C-terminal sensor domain
MGEAASYFVDLTDPDRQTLHRRITPSDAQYEDQQARWNALAEFLLPELQSASGYPMRSWLQGSYKFGTQVRPCIKGDEFDIDLGVYYCWEGRPDDGEHGPKSLKGMVQDALNEFLATNDDVIEVIVPPKSRCCRIRFQGDFHIDVPCYHLDETRDARALATEANVWEGSDPKAIYKWFTTQFEDYKRSRVRRLVRYAKAWAALKFREENGRPPSVLLTVLIAEAVLSLSDELPGPEDEAFASVMQYVYHRVRAEQDIRNPADADENLAARMSTRDWKRFLDELGLMTRTAEEAIAADSELNACTIWSDVFDQLFPLPEASTLQKNAAQLPVRLNQPEVQVKAVSRDNPNFRYSEVNQIGPIPKNCNITFRITNPFHFPPGTEFRWMVRNEGDEAEDINDLGHIAGRGLETTERSAYNGTHYMDCTAVAGGRMIGIRRVPVRVHSATVPRRHLPKPTWTRIKGRR